MKVVRRCDGENDGEVVFEGSQEECELKAELDNGMSEQLGIDQKFEVES